MVAGPADVVSTTPVATVGSDPSPPPQAARVTTNAAIRVRFI
jgi:hypothetical protein